MSDGEQKDSITGGADEVAAEQSQKHILPIHSFLADYVRRLAEKQNEAHEHTGHRTRLRESAKHDDLYGFSDVELVELLLSFFIPQKDTNIVAHRLVDRFGSVAGVLCAPQAELIKLSNITAQAASVLTALFELCLAGGQKEIKLQTCAEAADFFALAQQGKNETGTYAAFLDGELNVRAIECYRDGATRDILSSACKHRCKYAFIARRESDLFPQTFNIAEQVHALSAMLTDMGMTMLDYIIFTDYGYYTVGAPAKDRDWYPLYIFVPAVKYMRSPDMIGNALSDGHAIYAGRETAEPLDNFAAQLCAVIKDN